MAKEKGDETEFRHQISCSDDQKVFILVVDCDLPISPDEFGAVCISLGKDIVKGRIKLDNAADASNNEDFQ